ncbi:E3 ubiquitin-protein ligase RNF126 isoform X3 [Zootermopsis nevadensis]|uniref:E3 ubiquitin-protein ligase RNF126 isoform X3 n=1 Tax=Zootermopsis nevadensis TaxID=136037 RepID=UPI000B8ED268|nr:E3 ubiquitin-protein ligase RNF126 isoform X3 [Zootermopsis nevadensis]
MAEAAVQDAAIARFFCHKCSVEIPRVLPDYTCPNCYSGFIEELEAPPDLTDDSDTEMEDVAPIELLNQRLGDELNEILLGVSGGNDERRVLRGRDRDGSDSRRPGRYGSIIPRQRIMRNSCVSRVPRGRQMAPIENLIQDFLVNLTGVGWGALGGARAGNAPVFFLGNPGDYAWGREGLDAIVTQLLNQMDGTGPPPLAKDKIKEIPVVVITQDQVGKSLQCSVCWEDFRLDEPVRKLPCEHVYHENCIIPWLELHGTCPICRKSLGDEGLEDHQPGSGGSNMSNVGPSLAAFFS